MEAGRHGHTAPRFGATCAKQYFTHASGCLPPVPTVLQDPQYASRPAWQRAEPAFFWNRHLAQPLLGTLGQRMRALLAVQLGGASTMHSELHLARISQHHEHYALSLPTPTLNLYLNMPTP